MSQKDTVFAWREILVILILSLAILAVLPVGLDESTGKEIGTTQSESTDVVLDRSLAHAPTAEEIPLEAKATVYLETWQLNGVGVELYKQSLQGGSESFSQVGVVSTQFFDVTSTGEPIQFVLDSSQGTGTLFVGDQALVATQLADGYVLAARVSPDGTMLAYTQYCGTGCGADENSKPTTKFVVVNLDTGKLLSSVTKNGLLVVRQWIGNNRLFLSPEQEGGEGEPTYPETFIWHIWNRTYTTVPLDPYARSFDLSDDGSFIAYSTANLDAESQTISSTIVRQPIVGGKPVKEDAPVDSVYSNVHWLSSNAVVFDKTTYSNIDWTCAMGPCLEGVAEIWTLDNTEIGSLLPGLEATVAEAQEGIIYYHDRTTPYRDIIRAYSVAEARSVALMDSPEYVHILRVIQAD